MLNFGLGIIVGLLIAILIVATLTFFRRVIEHKTEIIEKQIEVKGPRPKGYVIEPDSEAEDARNSIIAKNKALGRDTKVSDLL